MTEQVKCVICGRSVDKARAHAVVHQAQTYYACGPGCRDRFTRNPTKYVKAAPKGPTPTTTPPTTKPPGA